MTDVNAILDANVLQNVDFNSALVPHTNQYQSFISWLFSTTPHNFIIIQDMLATTNLLILGLALLIIPFLFVSLITRKWSLWVLLIFGIVWFLFILPVIGVIS